MSHNVIPQYHPSYTEEENLCMHEYLSSATEKELVQAIFELVTIYSNDKVKQALDNFIEEIKLRYETKQRYDILLQCRNEWKSYLTQLDRYHEATEIRLKYEQYKNSTFALKDNGNLIGSFIGYEYAGKKPPYDADFIRRATFSESSKNGIHRPTKPSTLYTELSSVPIKELSKEKALELFGKENLKALITILLGNVDGKEIASAPIILFLTRAFSYENHKKENKLFSSKLKTYNELKNCCVGYLDELKSFQAELNKLQK